MTKAFTLFDNGTIAFSYYTMGNAGILVIHFMKLLMGVQ